MQSQEAHEPVSPSLLRAPDLPTLHINSSHCDSTHSACSLSSNLTRYKEAPKYSITVPLRERYSGGPPCLPTIRARRANLTLLPQMVSGARVVKRDTQLCPPFLPAGDQRRPSTGFAGTGEVDPTVDGPDCRDS